MKITLLHLPVKLLLLIEQIGTYNMVQNLSLNDDIELKIMVKAAKS